jgi:hypothetical protein
MADRGIRLLTAAADEFERGADPFRTDWLVEHDVTYDECLTLSEQIAAAIRVATALIGGGDG